MSDFDHVLTAAPVWQGWDDDPCDFDGDDVDPDACPECGSDNVDWSDARYSCMHCGGVGR